MIPSLLVPTSLPLHLPFELSGQGGLMVCSTRKPTVAQSPMVVSHGVFRIPSIYYELLAPASNTTHSSSSAPLPSQQRIKAFVTSFACAWCLVKEGDLRNVSTLKEALAALEETGNQVDVQATAICSEMPFVICPFSDAAASAWFPIVTSSASPLPLAPVGEPQLLSSSTPILPTKDLRQVLQQCKNASAKAPTARDPLLILEWLAGINTCINGGYAGGGGSEGYDPETLYPPAQIHNESVGCCHFSSLSEAREAKRHAKSALERAAKRCRLIKASHSHFVNAGSLRGIANIIHILELLGNGNGDIAVCAANAVDSSQVNLDFHDAGNSEYETVYHALANLHLAHLPAALHSCTAAEDAVAEATLIVLYNLIHPVVGLATHKVPLTFRVPHLSSNPQKGTVQESLATKFDAPDAPVCLTHVARSSAPWREVRSEITKLRNGLPPQLVPLSGVEPRQPECGSLESFDYQTISLDAFHVKRERSLSVVTKMVKLNIYRPLFALLLKHSAILTNRTCGGSTQNSFASLENDTAEKCESFSEGTESDGLLSSHARIVYLGSLMLSALGGATKQNEESRAAEKLFSTMFGVVSPGSSIGGAGRDSMSLGGEADSEGDEDGGAKEDEDGDDSERKKKKKKKKSKNKDTGGFLGGCSSGPMRLSNVIGLGKTATLARLGGVSVALTNVLSMMLTLRSLPQQSLHRSIYLKPLQNIGSAWVVVGHRCRDGVSSGVLSPEVFVSALLCALATIAVGAPNITALYRRGLLPIICTLMAQYASPEKTLGNDGISPASQTLSTLAPSFTVLRWAIELLYRLLGPTGSKMGGGMMLVQVTADELTLVKDVFLKGHKGLSLLIRAAELGALTSIHPQSGLLSSLVSHSPFPSAPLFCAACDVLQLLLSIPSSVSLARTLLGPEGLSPLLDTLCRCALSDSDVHVIVKRNGSIAVNLQNITRLPSGLLLLSSETRAILRACPRIPTVGWVGIINHMMRVLDIRELPVGNGNDLAWFPPPELVEQLKRQQQLAAEVSSAAGNKGKEEPENSAVDTDAERANDDSDGGEDDDDEEEDNFPEEDLSSVSGLHYFSPELHYMSNNYCSDSSTQISSYDPSQTPKIPSHTSILGVMSVHHIKPFTSPRPIPSSSAVINNCSPPNLIEPLLVQDDATRCEVVKGQLGRFIHAHRFVAHTQVVFDDLARATVLPKTRLASLLSAAGAGSLASRCAQPSWLRPQMQSGEKRLSFDSAFESGNLKRAIHVHGNEYDLILHTDVNTNSFVQWFYFAVGNIVPNVPYRFNIINMEKESSTFNDGQRPLMFSERRYEETNRQVAWTREGHDIAYYRNSYAKKSRERYVPKELVDVTAKKGDTVEDMANDDNDTVDTIKKSGGASRKGSSSNLKEGAAVSAQKKKKEGSVSSPANVKAKSTSSGTGTSSSNGKSGNGSSKSGASNANKLTAPSSKSARSSNYTDATYYTLSFTIVFPYGGNDERVYLCNAYPYTYSDLIGYCRRLMASHDEACAKGSASDTSVPPHCLFVQSLCPTLSGNATPLLTITSLRKRDGLTHYSEKEISKRPIVLLTARVHPGESNASYMIKGCLDLLMNPVNTVAQQLRDQFVFKVVPMLNPDGVINGNHRCGLAGTDLNRGYHKPSRWRNPTIFHLKALVYHMKKVEKRNVLVYTDFHGHSRCHNGVIYGCGEGNSFQALFGGLLPNMKPSPGVMGGSNASSPSVTNLIGIGAPSASSASTTAASLLSATGKKKSPEAIAETFGFHQTLNPHPFMLPSNATNAVSPLQPLSAVPRTTLDFGPPERLLPLLLEYFCPYFSFASSTFNIQKGKRNTGRVVFYRQLGIRMSYTVEASMMGGVGCDFALVNASACDDFPTKLTGFPNVTSEIEAAPEDDFDTVLRRLEARRSKLSSFGDGSDPSSRLPTFSSLSQEHQRRIAAQWSIQNDQLSGLQSSATHNRVVASALTAPASSTNAGHFAPRHYATIGMMFLKSLHYMWSSSSLQTTEGSPFGSDDDPYYVVAEQESRLQSAIAQSAALPSFKERMARFYVDPHMSAQLNGLPPSLETALGVLHREVSEAKALADALSNAKKKKRKRNKGKTGGRNTIGPGKRRTSGSASGKGSKIVTGNSSVVKKKSGGSVPSTPILSNKDPKKKASHSNNGSFSSSSVLSTAGKKGQLSACKVNSSGKPPARPNALSQNSSVRRSPPPPVPTAPSTADPLARRTGASATVNSRSNGTRSSTAGPISQGASVGSVASSLCSPASSNGGECRLNSVGSPFSGSYAHATRKGGQVPSVVKTQGAMHVEDGLNSESELAEPYESGCVADSANGTNTPVDGNTSTNEDEGDDGNEYEEEDEDNADNGGDDEDEDDEDDDDDDDDDDADEEEFEDEDDEPNVVEPDDEEDDFKNDASEANSCPTLSNESGQTASPHQRQGRNAVLLRAVPQRLLAATTSAAVATTAMRPLKKASNADVVALCRQAFLQGPVLM